MKVKILNRIWSIYEDKIKRKGLKKSYRKRNTTLKNLEKHKKGGYDVVYKLD